MITSGALYGGTVTLVRSIENSDVVANSVSIDVSAGTLTLIGLNTYTGTVMINGTVSAVDRSGF